VREWLSLALLNLNLRCDRAECVAETPCSSLHLRERERTSDLSPQTLHWTLQRARSSCEKAATGILFASSAGS